MEDYPRTLQEFEARFSTEEGCREYLFQLRWPEGFRCPRCGCGKAWAVRATLFQCSSCNGQTPVTAGTVFQDTRKPLSVWFRAMWFVTGQKNGASALGLQRVLGLGSYRTAWSWLHKLRRAMVRSGRDRLAGWVEVDETYLGGLPAAVFPPNPCIFSRTSSSSTWRAQVAGASHCPEQERHRTMWWRVYFWRAK